MKVMKESPFSREPKRSTRGFNFVVLAVVAVVIVGCIVGYIYWPRAYRTEYFVIVLLLFLNIIFFYGFVRHNSRRGRKH